MKSTGRVGVFAACQCDVGIIKSTGPVGIFVCRREN